MEVQERTSLLKPHRASAITLAAVSAVGSFVLLIVILSATTPTTAGPLGILIAFVLLYVLFVSLLFIGLSLVGGAAVKMGLRKPKGSRRTYYVASVLAFVPVLYLTLSSMGGVSFWGLFLIVVFVALSLFYVLRRL